MHQTGQGPGQVDATTGLGRFRVTDLVSLHLAEDRPGAVILRRQLLEMVGEDDAIVGVFNIGAIVRGLFKSAYLGYYALAPHAGAGYMAEGLELALRVAFRRLKLHRVEANVQPDNRRSLALVRRAGFVREGFSRRYVRIGGRWRDHVRMALLVEDWRARRTRARP